MSQPDSKLEQLRQLEEAIDIIENEKWPDFIKAELYLLVRRFMLIVMGMAHAGFVEEFQAFHEYLSERALTLKKRCEEEALKEKRSKIKVVKDDEDPTFH